MSGHSKWAQIKRQKGVTDARRGKLFTKLGREVQRAARLGGPDPDENPALRLAVSRARQANMPKDNVERAIERATASGSGEDWDEIRYEAYGPGGVAMLIDTLTNNRNRTVAEVRAALTKAGGSMGETGSVAWVFEQKGVIAIDLGPGMDADSIALAAIDAGAEDVQVEEGLVEVLTDPSGLEAIRATLEGGGVRIGSAEVMMRPGNSVGLEEDKARGLMKLIDALEDLDDVQRVYSNADFPDSVLVEA